MYQPISLALQQGEILPVAMMGSLYKSYMEPVCAVMAAHFAAHAMNICALPPWNSDLGAPLMMGTNGDVPVTQPRRFSAKQIIDLVTTTLQGPAYSAELVPYTSDLVLDISPATVEKMRNSTFTNFTNADFKQSECIDSAHSVPNGSACFRAEDCEGASAMTILMQHHIRAMFYDGAEYLAACNTNAGMKAMTNWVQSKKFCNIDLTPATIYPFVVNLVAIAAVTHLAFDAKLLIIGAMCATPLIPIDQTMEAGHAASVGRVNMQAVNSVTTAVYDHYADPATKFLLLKLPMLDGATAMGRPSNSEAVHLAGDYAVGVPSVTLAKQPTNFQGCPDTTKLPLGCHVMQPAFDSNFSCVNVTPLKDDTPLYQFQMLESTTSLHTCPVRGYISAARMNSLATAKGVPICATPALAGVPVEQFLKAVQCAFIKPYLTVTDDVRLEGFMHSTDDVAPKEMGEVVMATEFYHTFYQMDSFSLSSVESDGTILVGADALTILNSSYKTNTCTMMEPTLNPILSAVENVGVADAMNAQWKESRLPFVGMDVLRQMLSSWSPATIINSYCPDNEAEGIMRCNVAVSGELAEKLFTDMSPGGIAHMAAGSSSNGMIVQQHPIRMGCRTTIASQAIRASHFKPTK
jgi:hypothetical protein